MRTHDGEVLSLLHECTYCEHEFEVPVYNHKYNKTASHLKYHSLYSNNLRTTPCVHCPHCGDVAHLLDKGSAELLTRKIYYYSTVRIGDIYHHIFSRKTPGICDFVIDEKDLEFYKKKLSGEVTAHIFDTPEECLHLHGELNKER